MRASASRRLGALWAAHSRKVAALAVTVTAVVLWRALFSLAGRFVALSEAVAEAGFFALGLSLALTGATYLYWRRSLNPESVFRLAMRQLRASPAVRDALGDSLSASETRAFVLSGGGLKLRGWRPALRSKRCHLLFPLIGSKGRGIVSAEAKKVAGRTVFKLLCLDVPSPARSVGEARVYLAGDAGAYSKSMVLSELRDPLVASLVSEPQAEAEDEVQDALGSSALALEPSTSSSSTKDAFTDSPAPADADGPSAEEQAQQEEERKAAEAAAEEARAAAEEELYAWDHFTRWLQRKRARQGREGQGG